MRARLAMAIGLISGVLFAVVVAASARASTVSGGAGADGRIAFVTDHGHVYTVDPNGAHLTRVAIHPQVPPSWQLAWSHDGQWLAISQPERHDQPGAGSAISIVGARDTLPLTIPLPGMTLTDDPPSWSPDDQRLAFAAMHGAASDTDLFTIDRDGVSLTQITDAAAISSWWCESPSAPAWSPNGSRIAFGNAVSGYGAICTVPATALSTPVAVVRRDGAAHPRWSPTGSRILFGAGDGLFTARPNGAGLQQLQPGSTTTYAWSPGGARIAFSSQPEAHLALMNANTGGAEIEVPADLKTSYAPAVAGGIAWSPSGRRLAFLYRGSPFSPKAGDIMVVDVTTRPMAVSALPLGAASDEGLSALAWGGAGAPSPAPNRASPASPRTIVSGWTVVRASPGDSLWSIASRRLASLERVPEANLPNRDIALYWVAVNTANRGSLRSGNPNVIYQGDAIRLPPLPRALGGTG